jgi:hypothetical protein
VNETNPLIAAFAKGGELAISFMIAAFFGLIRYLQDFVGTEPPAFKWLIAGAKILTAGAVGLLVHWLVVEWKVSGNFSAFLIAVAGYGGAESINAFKEVGLDFIRRKAASTADPGPKN